MTAQVESKAIESDSISDVEIYILLAQELPVPRINNYGSVEFVDGLDGEQQKRLLLIVLNNGGGNLVYARRLFQNDDPQSEPDPPANIPAWCICGN
ncbi:hypothetical protein ACROYT_G015368 [Oculina patagonica]